ncbi:glycosyltransferase involved in cell wall biosynthesis [Demequina lutea]|uniref:D-inositol 3-phosphate glycosyltransferase n=2 Tax=Demequina lutea TaxID=431489 RepID=A0A7Z0CJ58_9MICO|nr:glycosyltransferase involved in cell wall biosynthesis [Demequina lutea]
MGRKQGLENLVETARLAEERGVPIHIVMLGDGAERKQLGELAAGLDRIIFMDPLPGDEFPLALAAADALLVNELPGVSEMAVPSKLTSYFAAAKPVVAAVGQGGIVASIMGRAQAGPVVESGNPGALLGALKSLSSDIEEQERASRAAKAYWHDHLSAEMALAAWDEILVDVTRR